MDYFAIMLAALVGYLLGSLSFSRIMLKLFAADQKISDLDIPVVGTDETVSMNIFGANSVSMILGAKMGILVAILDILKVALPMLIFKFFLYPGQTYFLIIGVTGLIGHNWPIYHRFKGGRGFSVLMGSFFVIDWLGALLTPFFGMILAITVLQNMMVAFVGWLWLMIPWLWFRTYDLAYLAYAISVNVIFLIGTIPEIKQFAQFRREGKLEAYREGLYDSSSMWQGMKRMNDRIQSLGKWRYIIGFFTLVTLILTLMLLPILPF